MSKKPKKPETVQINLRLPLPLWEALRVLSYKNMRSMNSELAYRLQASLDEPSPLDERSAA